MSVKIRNQHVGIITCHFFKGNLNIENEVKLKRANTILKPIKTTYKNRWYRANDSVFSISFLASLIIVYTIIKIGIESLYTYNT